MKYLSNIDVSVSRFDAADLCLGWTDQLKARSDSVAHFLELSSGIE